MRLNILFLKRKYIYYFLMILTTVILLFIYLFTRQFKEVPTSTVVSKENAIKEDFNGDGENELLHINSDDSKYTLYISKGKEIFPLETADKPSLISDDKEYWPMRLTLVDVNRNNLPEIIVQGSINDSSAITIFASEENSYKSIFESGSNVLGVLDSTSGKTPLLYSGKFTEKGLTFKENLLLFNNVKTTNRKLEETIAGKDIVSNFINYMQTLPYISAELPAYLDSHLLDSYDYSTVSKLHSANKTYTFLDAFFQDTEYTDTGVLNALKWSLTFKTINTSEKKPSGYVTINLLIEKDESKTFKLSSISLEEQ